IIDKILHNLSPASVVQLKPLNRFFNCLASTYIARVWDWNKFMRRIVPNPESFRDILMQTQAIVSGSQTTQFFSRTEYPQSDCDVYVEPHGLIHLGQWLEHNGFIFRRKRSQHFSFKIAALTAIYRSELYRKPPVHYGATPIIDVYLFEHSDAGPSHKIPIQVIAVGIKPIDCVLRFHSSK
ncbi:hypothetical protein K474DRAFT_1563592, partial [Panus rudis PR-1116 ss-1]